MKKKLLTILFPVLFTLVCAVAGWGNEQNAAKPCCDKAAKAAQEAPKAAGCDGCAQAGKVEQGKGCANCAKKADAAQGCGNCAKKTNAEQGKGCTNCATKQAAEAKPCGGGDCAKQAEKKQQDANKPCCDKMKP